jgi:hypothetical protein
VALPIIRLPSFTHTHQVVQAQRMPSLSLPSAQLFVDIRMRLHGCGPQAEGGVRQTQHVEKVRVCFLSVCPSVPVCLFICLFVCLSVRWRSFSQFPTSQLRPSLVRLPAPHPSVCLPVSCLSRFNCLSTPACLSTGSGRFHQSVGRSDFAAFGVGVTKCSNVPPNAHAEKVRVHLIWLSVGRSVCRSVHVCLSLVCLSRLPVLVCLLSVCLCLPACPFTFSLFCLLVVARLSIGAGKAGRSFTSGRSVRLRYRE